jgi:hypothetical protein
MNRQTLIRGRAEFLAGVDEGLRQNKEYGTRGEKESVRNNVSCEY